MFDEPLVAAFVSLMSLETWRQLAAMYKVITKKKSTFLTGIPALYNNVCDDQNKKKHVFLNLTIAEVWDCDK